MGLSFGGTSQNSNASSTATPSYTSAQSGLQSTLASLFQTLLPGAQSGGISPNVQATETAANNQTNQTAAGLGSRMTKFLASRGFGSSGTTGTTALQGELSRESQLGANASAASGQQLAQNNTMLQDSLAAAYANPGSSNTGTNSGSSSGYGLGLSGVTNGSSFLVGA
jgi:hypothetical protein